MAAKSNNTRGQFSSLFNIADLALLQAQWREAQIAAQKALEIAQMGRDMEKEVMALLSLAYVHLAKHNVNEATALRGRCTAITRDAGDVRWARAAHHQIEVLRVAIATRLGQQPMAEGSALSQEFKAANLAPAACAAAYIYMATGHMEGALAAAKEAQDLFLKLRDDAGVAAASMVLAACHISAGNAEDEEREKYFLPLATHHAAAAGAAAERALRAFSRRGLLEGMRSAQAILTLERVKMTAPIRHQPFSYETWNCVNR